MAKKLKKKKQYTSKKSRENNGFFQGFQHRTKAFIIAAIIASISTFWFIYDSNHVDETTKPKQVVRTMPSVVQVFNHDPKAFTQGFAVAQRVDPQTRQARTVFYESTGLRGHSTLREIDIASGKILRKISLEDELFGEGIAVVGNKILMLTWQSTRGLIYDADSFKRLAEFPIRTTTGEGWGITLDSKNHLLVVSDGSPFLHFWDPDALPALRQAKPKIKVIDENGKTVQHLNELEYVDGEILANVWYQDRIARIDPDTGVVLGWIHLRGLIDPYRSGQEDCLNGIAYDPTRPQSLYVTGKQWPRAFELHQWR